MNKFENENVKACGTAADEIKEQNMNQDVAGGYDSAALGNQGKHCSLTLECQHICNWISWGNLAAYNIDRCDI